MSDVSVMKPIPTAQWGRDHWSTFAYIAHCIVNSEGKPNRHKMRCDPAQHPGQANGGGGEKFPTRLRDGSEVHGHDDWSCLEDAAGLGLVEWRGTGLHPTFAFTEAGWKLWHRLERYVAEHPHNWSETFDPEAQS